MILCFRKSDARYKFPEIENKTLYAYYLLDYYWFNDATDNEHKKIKNDLTSIFKSIKFELDSCARQTNRRRVFYFNHKADEAYFLLCASSNKVVNNV